MLGLFIIYLCSIVLEWIIVGLRYMLTVTLEAQLLMSLVFCIFALDCSFFQGTYISVNISILAYNSCKMNCFPAKDVVFRFFSQTLLQ